MKRVIFLTCLLTLIGCTCLPQIPTQIVYADINCTAILPNYIEMFDVRDNCENVVITQIPPPGTLMDVGRAYIDVVITATDISNNTDIEHIEVVMIDTIPPELIPKPGLLSYSWDLRKDLLNGFQASLFNIVSDSVRNTHTLAMFSSPDMKHWGAYWPCDQEWCPCDSTDYEALGLTVVKLELDPENKPDFILSYPIPKSQR